MSMEAVHLRMTARPTDEPHRTVSSLELLFDLTFFVAIASITEQLAHSVAEGHALQGLTPFLQVFFALWWLYFLEPAGDGLARRRDRFIPWGYGHYGIFAALAALGAGLKVAVEQNGHHITASPVVAGYAVAIPVGVFLVLLWAVHAPIVTHLAVRPAVMLGGAVVILLLPLTAAVIGLAVVVATIAAVCALIIVTTLVLRGTQKVGLQWSESSRPMIGIQAACTTPPPSE